MRIIRMVLLAILAPAFSLGAKYPVNHYANNAKDDTSYGLFKDTQNISRKDIADDEKYPNVYRQMAHGNHNHALRKLMLKHLGASSQWIRNEIQSSELENELELALSILSSVESEEERSQVINELERTKTHDNGHYTLEANLLYLWGDFEAAENVFQKMIDIGIANAESYITLSDCQEKLGRITDAYTTLSRGLDKFPDEMGLKYCKGRLGVFCGNATEVLGMIDQLISTSPGMPDLYNLKGVALLTTGQYAEACEPLLTAVLLRPCSIFKLYYGDALRLSGQPEKAKSEYRDILHMTEDQILEDNQIPQRIYAMVYSSLGKKKEALECIQRLRSEKLEVVVPTMAYVYSRLGEKREAIDMLKKYASDYQWNPIFDLFSIDLFPLHTEKDFATLLAQHGIKTKFNEETQLLELDVQEFPKSLGGIPLEKFKNTLANITDPLEVLRKAKELCPIDLGSGGQITNIDQNEKNKEIIFYITLPSTTLDVEIMERNPRYKEKKLNIIALGIISESQQFNDIGWTTTHVLKTLNSEKEIVFSVTPQRIKELQRLSKSQDEIDKMMIDYWVEEENLLSASSSNENPAEYNGEYYIWTYPLEEDDFLHNELYFPQVKNNLMGLFKDISMRKRLETIARQGAGFKVIMKNKANGRTAEIVFSQKDITENLEKYR